MAIDRPNEPERPVGVDNPEMGWGNDVAEVIGNSTFPISRWCRVPVIAAFRTAW